MNERELAAAQKVAERINAQRVAAGSTPLGKAPSLPDMPACDFCGKLYSANLACSACQSVFYCTAACQKAHWRKAAAAGSGGGGHRAQCKTMRETCEKVAQRAVEQMKNTTTNGFARIDNTMLSTLDGTGAYRVAVASFGLNDAIRQLFVDDQAELLSRYSNPNRLCPRFCYTNSVVSALFRGQRMEGRDGMTSSCSFGCIDGQRIKSYVKSHPDAFMHWWEASLEVYKMPLDNAVWNLGQDLHFAAHMCARDVWAAWSLVFVDKRAARAILLPDNTNTAAAAAAATSSATTNNDSAAADARAKYMGATIHKILSRRWNVSNDRDHNSVLEGLLNQLAALIQHRLVEFQIIPDNNNNNNFFVKQLQLKGMHKHMYEDITLPVAKAMIAKGGMLTNDEYKKAIQRTLAAAGRH